MEDDVSVGVYLLVYKKSHKSTLVSRGYAADPKLGIWVSNQRAAYKKKEMTVERINLLEYVGFVWSVLEHQWMKKYERLVAFREDHNHVRVPLRYEADRELGIWIFNQRQRKGKMSSDRQKLLNSIGFVWNAS